MTAPSASEPHDLEAERSVLGACLLGGGRAAAAAAEIVQPKDFWVPAHESIFEAILAVHATGAAPDATTVADYLTRTGDLGRVGGLAALAELAHAVPTAANVVHYGRIVCERSYVRRTAASLQRALELTRTGDAGKVGDAVAELLAEAPASGRPQRAIRLARADTIRPERVRWAWSGRLPLGALSLLAGREGLGKSTIAVDLAAQVTRGLLDGELAGRPRGVLYVATEDSLGHTVVPRLHAAGADMGRVQLLEAVLDVDGSEDRLTLPTDAGILAGTIREHDIAMVVLDAATSVLDSRLDGDRDRAMRRALEPLAGVAMSTGAAIVGIVHLGKAATADVGRAILGSIAWSQVARSVLAVALDADTGSLVLSRTKCNLAGPVPSLSARIVSGPVALDNGDLAEVGRIEWLGETDADVRDLLAPAVDADPDARSAAEEAGEWLVDWLAERGGEASRQDVEKAGRASGHSISSLKRAKASRGSGVSHRSEGYPRQTIWYLDASALADGPGHQSVQQSAQVADGNTAGHAQSAQLAQSAQACAHPELTDLQSAHPHAPVELTEPTGPTGDDLHERESGLEPTVEPTGELTARCPCPNSSHGIHGDDCQAR